jgi:hypothetical protein
MGAKKEKDMQIVQRTPLPDETAVLMPQLPPRKVGGGKEVFLVSCEGCGDSIRYSA